MSTCVHMRGEGEGDSMLVEKHLKAESPAETQQVLCPPKGTNRGRGSADSPHKSHGNWLMDKWPPEPWLPGAAMCP